MTQEQKYKAFQIAAAAERRRETADPYYEPDSYWFGQYDGIDDILVALGLIDEYEEWKRGAEK